ncbi:MAG TPA: sialidase family protein, partial [Cryomorphaceae bacterium]|nr:sialidase family protein [Cryomorphaceae bacterium]
MKIKNLLLTLGFVAIAGLVWFVVNDEEQEVAAYVPRSNYNTVETGAKGAFEYYETIKANVYTGQVEGEDVLRMQKALKKVKIPQAKNSDIEWESMGPNNVGGRTRAILPLSQGANSLIAGAVSGGLFRTDNGGLSWDLLEGFDPYLVVSSLAELGNGAIYAATGNSRESPNGQGRSGFIGRGLFVSNDGGATWELVSDFEPDPTFSLSSDWANIDVIKADPTNPNKLWIGSNLGFYGYIHGSSTLEENQLFTLNISNDTVPVTANIKDIDISQDGQTFIVVSGARVFISNDGGENFTHINCGDCFSGLPSSFGTAEVAISRNNSEIMYLSLALPNGYLRGVYATVNGGDTWSIIAPQSNNGGQLSQFTPFFNGVTAQGWYDHMLTSIPNDESEEIIMGGIRMWRWQLTSATPGITAWEEVNANFTSGPGQPPSPIYVHSDIHTDAWDSEGRLYAGTDGGVFRSDNNGMTWAELVQDYVTTQYYAIAFNPDGQVLGGT